MMIPVLSSDYTIEQSFALKTDIYRKDLLNNQNAIQLLKALLHIYK